jgi:murein DD-endopeptidase MepM/ murein hydrolase activator NlpD
MQTKSLRPNLAMIVIAFLVLFGILLACVQSADPGDAPDWSITGLGAPPAVEGGSATPAALLPESAPGGPFLTPTPDPPHPLPPPRTEVEYYTVEAGDFLSAIAQQFGVSLNQLIQANGLTDPNLVEVGVTLTIPVPIPEGKAPAFKIIPDSELVYGPSAAGLDIAAFVAAKGGYLNAYSEEIEEKEVSGAKIIERVAQDYSVNPRLLLAVLEYQSGWLTQADPRKTERDYPIGLVDPHRKGLYRQIAWAANSLNRGYYLWRVNAVGNWLVDGLVLPVDATINAGTAGVQHFFSLLYGGAEWEQAVGQNGLFATYTALFGYPFNASIEPLAPADLVQPALRLPFEDGRAWSFTGGPHGGWDSGSAWSAIDFAPPGEALGCVLSDEWVVAAADGLIVRSKRGAVMQDLDGDGNEGTGWVIFYMHIESRNRVPEGTYLRAGERIGHPSCEGGISNGTHLHLARKYNGEWISADRPPVLMLDGWTTRSAGSEYDGYLDRDGYTIEAWEGRRDENAISR